MKWHEQAPEGKLDLVVTLDFRMSTTCLYSDIVLPTASWYEKNDLNTSDMHPFIHPLSAAVDPVWQSKSDWEIYKGFAKAFSEVCVGHLGVEKEVVLTPLMHDSPAELAQPFDVKEWKKGQCELIPGKTAPQIAVVERDYPNVYKRFTALGPLMDKLGNGGKGIGWKTGTEVEQLGQLNGKTLTEGVTQGMPKIVTDIDACEVILQLAPETNGHVAVKAWQALGKQTGRDHTHLALYREDEKIRYRDIQAQPRKIISSPTWSGIESETVSYNAGYTNVHELIPWRTLTGRQQFYLDHPWVIAFGEGMSSYRPPVDLKTTSGIHNIKPNGNKEILLNFITPHQKWGIHSTYSDNLMMLTLNRGGPVVWLSEDDAKVAGVEDNDWVEVFNINGAIAARAVVSQRVNPGMLLMYHAQEKIINTPGSQITGVRGGIHNSVTRIVLKPTHMIGGYAQFSYGFNYYGTIGTNRDEFVVVRKMDKVDWLDTPRGDEAASPGREPLSPEPSRREAHESPRTDRHGAEPGQVHRLPHLQRDLQERLDQPPRRRIRLVQQRRDQARHRLPQGVGEPGQVERRLDPQRRRLDQPAPGRQVEAADAHLRQPEPAADRRLLRALHLRLRPPAVGAGDEARAHRAAAFADHRPAHGEDRLGPELGRDPGRRIQQAQQGQELRRHPEGHLRPVREHLHDVPAPAVRALPEPGVRGLVPVGQHLQA